MIFSVRKAEYGDIKEMSNILNEIINEGGLTRQNSITTPADFKGTILQIHLAFAITLLPKEQKLLAFNFLNGQIQIGLE